MRQEVIGHKKNLDNTRKGAIQNPSLGHLSKNDHPTFDKKKEHNVDIRIHVCIYMVIFKLYIYKCIYMTNGHI